MPDALIHGDPQRTYELFEELFRGSGQAHGLVHGECVRTPPTEELFRQHLFGVGSLGIYPTVKLTQGTLDGTQLVCRWACTDIDTHGPRAFTPLDARVHAKNVVTALHVLGHQGWVELTKSEGYHVWLFAADWCDAQAMRSVLLLAHQLADVPAYEVNPKDALGATELGNYVNICYPWMEPNETIRALESGESGLAVGDHRGGGLHRAAGEAGPGNAGGSAGLHDGRGRGLPGGADSRGGSGAETSAPAQHGGAPQGSVGVASAKHCGQCGVAVRNPPVVGRSSFEHSAYRPRRVVIDPATETPYCLPCFVEVAHAGRSTVRHLHETAALYVPPPPPAPVTMRAFSGLTGGAQEAGTDPGWANSRDIEDDQLREAVGMLSGKGWAIFRHGPNQGGRALTLFRLGVECRESGLNPDEAMTVLVDADWRWGKFLSGVDGHTNGIRYIEDIVRKIYG